MSFFFFKQKTAYEMLRSLVGSEMCIRDRTTGVSPYNVILGVILIGGIAAILHFVDLPSSLLPPVG